MCRLSGRMSEAMPNCVGWLGRFMFVCAAVLACTVLYTDFPFFFLTIGRHAYVGMIVL